MVIAMANFKFADVRYNGGAGALLCSICKVVLAAGFEHEDKEHFCQACKERNPKFVKEHSK